MASTVTLSDDGTYISGQVSGDVTLRISLLTWRRRGIALPGSISVCSDSSAERILQQA
jgi:hypothetical protein